MASRALFVVMAIAVALVSLPVADGQVAIDTTTEQSALGLRIHHLWESQPAIESRTRGDSARRADELLREVFHPYRKFWDPIVGASEAQFLRSIDRHLYDLNWEHRQPLPLGRDPGLLGVGRLDRITSFRIVEQYVAVHGPDSWRDLFVKPSMERLDASGYDARLAADSTVFRITTNEFWLNLHHFLYVLGRAQAGERDAAREAVAQAPVEAARVFARLDSADQATWTAAVTAYAEGVSKRDAVFDQQLTFIGNTLAGADATTHLPYGGPKMEVVEALRRAAPIYRDAWWPEHEVANRRWADSMRTLIDEHGGEVLAYIRRAYGMPWPVSGYPVRVVAYANWAGAYSTRGQLLVVSSLAPSTQGLYGMEINFHEAMHQWDDSVTTIIGQQANRHRVSAPVNLSHQMIFFTAGEAVRSVVPDHQPYAERFGLWERLGPGVHPVLKELWLPHLQGRGERDAAIGEVVRRLASP